MGHTKTHGLRPVRGQPSAFTPVPSTGTVTAVSQPACPANLERPNREVKLDGASETIQILLLPPVGHMTLGKSLPSSMILNGGSDPSFLTGGCEDRTMCCSAQHRARHGASAQ